MNWLNKLEQKYGSKAIPNITRIFIAANLIGSVLLLTKGDVVLYYLQFSASAILHGQVWEVDEKEPNIQKSAVPAAPQSMNPYDLSGNETQTVITKQQLWERR